MTRPGWKLSGSPPSNFRSYVYIREFSKDTRGRHLQCFQRKQARSPHGEHLRMPHKLPLKFPGSFQGASGFNWEHPRNFLRSFRSPKIILPPRSLASKRSPEPQFLLPKSYLGRSHNALHALPNRVPAVATMLLAPESRPGCSRGVPGSRILLWLQLQHS